LPLNSSALEITVIDHDKVRPLEESYPADKEYLKTFQPVLAVKSGCVSYPAVDEEGQVS
jgi:hypothetical protein